MLNVWEIQSSTIHPLDYIQLCATHVSDQYYPKSDPSWHAFAKWTSVSIHYSKKIRANSSAKDPKVTQRCRKLGCQSANHSASDVERRCQWTWSSEWHWNYTRNLILLVDVHCLLHFLAVVRTRQSLLAERPNFKETTEPNNTSVA